MPLKRRTASVPRYGRSERADEPGKAILRMAHELHLKVIAEGVPTQAQLDFLRKRRCDELQGHLFSIPLGAQAFAKRRRASAQMRPTGEAFGSGS